MAGYDAAARREEQTLAIVENSDGQDEDNEKAFHSHRIFRADRATILINSARPTQMNDTRNSEIIYVRGGKEEAASAYANKQQNLTNKPGVTGKNSLCTHDRGSGNATQHTQRPHEAKYPLPRDEQNDDCKHRSGQHVGLSRSHRHKDLDTSVPAAPTLTVCTPGNTGHKPTGASKLPDVQASPKCRTKGNRWAQDKPTFFHVGASDTTAVKVSSLGNRKDRKMRAEEPSSYRKWSISTDTISTTKEVAESSQSTLAIDSRFAGRQHVAQHLVEKMQRLGPQKLYGHGLGAFHGYLDKLLRCVTSNHYRAPETRVIADDDAPTRADASTLDSSTDEVDPVVRSVEDPSEDKPQNLHRQQLVEGKSAFDASEHRKTNTVGIRAKNGHRYVTDPSGKHSPDVCTTRNINTIGRSTQRLALLSKLAFLPCYYKFSQDQLSETTVGRAHGSKGFRDGTKTHTPANIRAVEVL
ncbi:hypothetical protein R3P38DRAFT_2765963 [Favolaschia claudopus]|uniref:Uncharacterized protein n=1 Tax=Favolaschia claudopus TaxID=2862362 RepID=A0AAW0CZM7_9AGAR